MTESWSGEGEKLDRNVSRKSRGPEQKAKRKRTPAEMLRAAELIEREKAYEAMMDERIRTLCPIIRAENEQRKRDSEEYHTEPRAMRVVIGSVPKSTVLDFD